jgi:hypothetical protein
MSMIGCFVRLTEADFDAVVTNPDSLHKFIQYDPNNPNNKDHFDVDKAWHGIHFLLTDSAWEGSGPLAFIVAGGREIDEDLGYGPARGFSSVEVKEIAAALEPIQPNALFEKADQEQFKAEDIYPSIWDEPKEECIGYVTNAFAELKQFIQESAAANRAVITYLG